jgi:hypothetical protein
MAAQTHRDGWQLKLVFNRHKSEVIELPATMSCREVWRHIYYHYPSCATYVLRRPVRARRAATTAAKL